MNLKQHLKSLSKDQLIKEIQTLSTKFLQVKQYYELRIKENTSNEILAVYKKRIKEEFFPTHGFGDGRLSVARKPIQEYKKIATDQLEIIDLMLYYVEIGVKYTRAYGDINEQFYNSMENMYENALGLIQQTNMHNDFYNRCKKIVTDTEGIGWGFYDNLSALFKTYFKKFES